MLLAVFLLLPLADVASASRMPSDCCCKSGGASCPLKKGCAQHCSMRAAESNPAQLQLPDETRDGASRTECAFTMRPALDESGVIASAGAVVPFRAIHPELQPPKRA